MSSIVEAVAAPVRQAVNRAAAEIVEVDGYVDVFAPRATGLGFDIARGDLRFRTARAVISEWLTAVALEAVPPDASLREAERWFYGNMRLPPLAPTASPPEIDVEPEVLFALLPYVLDSLRPGTRREVLGDQTAATDRRLRKERGAFYTPGDVAARMVDFVGLATGDTCLDPTCGTGVFLRHAVMAGADPTRVFGCDVDASVADASSFSVLAAAIRVGTNAPTPWACWQSIRLNHGTLNALRLRVGTEQNQQRVKEIADARHRLSSGEVVPPADPGSPITDLGGLFPELVDGADALLSNPPYAPIRDVAAPRDIVDIARVRGERVTGATRAEALLVEFAWLLTKRNRGRASVVLPLSVAASSRPEFVHLRRSMQEQAGSLSFYFFDRAPDALFGDDVKTRNVVFVYRAHENSSISTTRLLRWTSRTRNVFLRELAATPVNASIANGIPKIGSPEEARLYAAVRQLAGSLGDEVLRSRQVLLTDARPDAAAIWVAPTAYNWIGTVRDVSALIEHGHTSLSPLVELTFKDEALADAAYAVLTSRFAYWLWRVESDGFHVTTGFLRCLPFSLGQAPHAIPDLARAGRRLWTDALSAATTSVNKGKTTVSFSTLRSSALDEADQAVVLAFGIDAEARGCDVRGWHQNVVVVDFSDRRRWPLHQPPREPCSKSQSNRRS